ncbi:MAG: hypothetical protein ABW034_16140 [Steroidobacteraceae bacterium]
MLRSLTLSCLLAAALAASISRAEELAVPEATAAADRPSRGMSMHTVESRYGEPTKRLEAVGQPPITRWEYPGFVVYFENQMVIHAVAVG